MFRRRSPLSQSSGHLAAMSSPITLIGISAELAQIHDHITILGGEDRPWGRLLLGRWQSFRQSRNQKPDGVDVALVETAAGKVNAAMAAQAAIDLLQPRLLVNCGSAGALAPDLQVGDLVLGSPVLAHDQGIFLPGHPDGFVHTGSPLPTGRRRGFQPDAALLAHVRRATAEGGKLPALHTGPIVSGDQIVFQDGRKRWLYRQFAALAVENEGVAIAQVAHLHGLPWLVLRGISDLAASEAAFDYLPLLDFQEDGTPPGRLGTLARALSQERQNPGTLRRLQRFHRGVQQAMTSVGRCLEAVLPVLAHSS